MIATFTGVVWLFYTKASHRDFLLLSDFMYKLGLTVSTDICIKTKTNRNKHIQRFCQLQYKMNSQVTVTLIGSLNIVPLVFLPEHLKYKEAKQKIVVKSLCNIPRCLSVLLVLNNEHGQY